MRSLENMAPFARERRDNVKERRADFNIYRRSTDDVEMLLECLLPDPDRALSQGTPIRSRWQSKSTAKVRVEIGGKPYFLKRYNCAGCLYRVKGLFRSSKALRSWRAASQFLLHDIPTLRPLICMEERRLGLLGRSYILFPFAEGEGGTLLDVWPAMSDEERSGCLVKLAKIIGMMHHHGLFHGDLNWRNILVQKNSEGNEFFLVDLDGSKARLRPSESHAMKDIEHFVRDLNRCDAREEQKRSFLALWHQYKGSFSSGP